MRPLLTIAAVVVASGPIGLWAQCVAPFVTAMDRSMLFVDGRFMEVDARPPMTMQVQSDGLFFTDHAGQLCRFGLEARAVEVVQGHPADELQASGDRVAWRMVDSLWTLRGDRAHLLATGVQRFHVSDSLIVFTDSIEHELAASWKGRRIPLASVTQGSERPQWTQGANTVTWYDRGQRTLFYLSHGQVEALADSCDVGIAVNGMDVVAYWDDAHQEFMGRKGAESVRLSGMKPVNAQAGDGLVAFVDGTLKLKAWRGGDVVQLTDSMPSQYWVKDRVLLYLWAGRLMIWSDDGPVAVEDLVPEQWQVAGGRVVYLDINRELRSIRVDGGRERLSREPGISSFTLHGEAVVYPAPSGGTVVLCRGRRHAY